ncbi:MAG: CBS domain-containing protein, partial [Dehalococcoidia bacterium]|nr:CBS domain-containing protein [Dehalococcoidia bacterium]
DDEREMIDSIFELEETTAREVMTPRLDIVAADVNEDPSAVVRRILERGFSRVPLYEDDLDHIIGIIYAKDVLARLFLGQPLDLRAMARPAYFIPETRRVDELLHDLQRRQVHMAIVVDEYGGTAGLVTIEDLLEQIVGEIRDEYDHAETEPITKLSATEAIVTGRLTLEELADLTGVAIDTEDVDTVGGYISNQLATTPSIGDSVQVSGVTLTVAAMNGRRVDRVHVRFPEPEEKPVLEAGPGEAIVTGKLTLQELASLTHGALHLPDLDTDDTVGALVTSRLGRPPQPGDDLAVNGVKLTVLAVNGRRIDRLRVQWRAPLDDPARAVDFSPSETDGRAA